jgi:glycosyltransferase involved in cell wall biosynthesis
MGNGQPKVSVVICTKNSEEFIDQSIVSIMNQHYENLELIVVDNYSTDTTRTRVSRFVDKLLMWGPERTTQANFGILHAKGELIYLTGSDMTRDYAFIKEAVKKIQQGYDAIYMSVKTDKEVTHFWGRVKALERESYIGTPKESARFFKKSVWEELNGFDNNLLAFEEDFQHRLDSNGYKTGRIDEREYHLHEDDTLLKIFKKAFYYGKSQRAYINKHKHRAISKIVKINLKKFLKHPILLGGFIVYRIVQYTGGIGGYLSESFTR